MVVLLTFYYFFIIIVVAVFIPLFLLLFLFRYFYRCFILWINKYYAIIISHGLKNVIIVIIVVIIIIFKDRRPFLISPLWHVCIGLVLLLLPPLTFSMNPRMLFHVLFLRQLQLLVVRQQLTKVTHHFHLRYHQLLLQQTGNCSVFYFIINVHYYPNFTS